ncbi:HDOD domain-containing protein [Simiduia curdlanivorans]|uniref:HDOD domain-containing protein n=1 Tax=Simiduia curdlanivorans TaxID=1492769 RepID=A0ABV8V6K6_9GAMM|nr:HDOD domain-containing protein [Simiduia curdlanivorans]MDN3638897.1 HDOD domain-containing protein [Simiduia curdlanivorans]
MPLKAMMNNAQQLPNIPKIVQELIESFGDNNVNTDAIAKKIASDQVLTAKVLRMANSARYGGNRKIGSVNDAVVILGFNALRTLVLASGLTSAFKTPESFDIKQFWRNSFTCAALCKWLAKFTKLDPEVAFTCGMMHNIGGLLIHTLAPDKAAEIDGAVSQGLDRKQTQDLQLGFDFTDAGAELAQNWRFPSDIVDAVRFQLSPGQSAPYAKLVYLAIFILSMNASKHPEQMQAEFPDQLAESIGINVEQMKDKLAETKTLDSGLDALLG